MPQQISDQQRLDIKWAIEDLSTRADNYKLYADYYDGNHRPLVLATQEYQSCFSTIIGRFSENLCATVVDILKDRLKLTDFTHDRPITAAEATEEVIDPIAKALLTIWKYNRMDQLQGELFLETLKCGDGYIICWPDDATGVPAMSPNEARLCTVQYSDSERYRIEKAAKIWRTNDGFGRLNLFYPDRTEKFVTASKLSADAPMRADSYVVYSESEDELEGAGIVPNPYGVVPVFHFANNAAVGHFGVSELKAAIPSQDRLNKTIVDQLVVGEEHSLPVRYAIGYETPRDPKTGEAILNWKPGDWFLTRQKDAQLGQLAGADIKQFLEAADDARRAIARVTRTPLHYFQERTGTPPSGEALKTEEAPLTAKVRDRQIAFGNVFENLFVFALKVAGVDVAALEAVWANTEPRDETALINQESIKVDKLGFSKQQAMRELEYSDAEIAKIKKEKDAETAAATPPAFQTNQPPPTGPNGNQPGQQQQQQSGAVN